MAEAVNQQISDKLTERQLLISRVESSLRREAWDQLRILEAEIISALKVADPTDFALLARRRQEVETLMAAEIDPLITARYAQLARLLDAAMGRLAVHEAGVVQRSIQDVIDEPSIETPADAALRRRVAGSLFPSASTPTDFSTTGADWWQRQGASLRQRVGDQLMVSVSLEEPLTEAVTRIRGTSDQAFTDGIMAKARNDAARLVRTQTTNAVSEARVAVAERTARPQFILIHSSVLDSRTSSTCLARHGLQFTSDTHEPINHSLPYLGGPPYHPSCRSSMIVGMRGGGPIMEHSLATWLQRRGPAFQDEVLGPTRARMFRAGTLTPRNLIDSLSGKPLTLEELGA
jgi:hypothetical protein